MKNALIGALALGAIGAGIFALTGREATRNLASGEWRIAIGANECPEQNAQGWDYLQAHCFKHQTVRGHCVCVTDSEEPLASEVDPATLPDAAFRRVAVCQHDEDGKPVQTVEVAKMTATKPPGWTCKLIAPRVLWVVSMRGVKSQVVAALQSKCCADCPGNCYVGTDSWGHCPYCLLDDTCGQWCPVVSDGGV